jgi:hypothetical protein
MPMSEVKLNKHQNFLSVDSSTAINSYREYFVVGEKIMYREIGTEKATILNFILDKHKNRIIVNTNKGWAHLDFVVKCK